MCALDVVHLIQCSVGRSLSLCVCVIARYRTTARPACAYAKGHTPAHFPSHRPESLRLCQVYERQQRTTERMRALQRLTRRAAAVSTEPAPHLLAGVSPMLGTLTGTLGATQM
jgi:hypothetical protein